MKEDPRNNKTRWETIIAAGVTMMTALVLLLILLYGKMTWPPAAVAAASVPEPEEELFIDPELLDLGEEQSEQKDAPAPAPAGEPEKSPEKVEEVVVKGVSEKPAPPKERKVTAPVQSPVKATEPKMTDEDVRKIKDRTAGAFSENGSKTGSKNAAGSGGTGAGIAGNVAGRELISCPRPEVKLRNKTVITVKVTVDAEGRVTEARAIKGGDAGLRSKCAAAALKARWRPKEGAAPAKGTIIFTLVPRG